MTIRKSMMLMLCVLVPILGSAKQVATLDQTLHFKWKGLPVATVDFKVLLPVRDHLAKGSSDPTPYVRPKALIEVTGRTRGPLRLVEDYQATAKYVQLDTSGKNAMTLFGFDNGEPEQREILFAPGVIPQVSTFTDSTAERALQPELTWARDTSNPLGVFKLMLELSINDKECAAQTWAYDGKRRYMLRLERSGEGALSAERLAKDKLFRSEIARRYICKITMVTEGMQSAASDAKPSVLASRLAALWPFDGDDRELLFDFWVHVGSVEKGYIRLTLNEIQVITPLGAVIGRN